MSSELPVIKFDYSNKQIIYTPESDIRSLDQTLLTFPEWYLVYSPEELASLTKSQTLDKFPFYREIWQYWDSYLTISKYAHQIGSNNFAYHVMLIVIGSSTTVEYFLRGMYENSIGKFTVYLAGRADEDDYAAKVATQYAQFINYYPWYEFDFWHSLTGLWHLPLFGENFIRKVERRYILTTEYLIKYFYAKLIGVLTHGTYGVAKLYTVAVINRAPENFKNIPQYKQLGWWAGNLLVELPRYYPFKDYALNLAEQGVDFVEIAGNRSFIALSVIAREIPPNNNYQTLFKQQVYTNPGYERLFIVVPINQLSNFLRSTANQKITIEHIYDY